MNELPKIRFEFPFMLIDILIMTYLNGQSRRVIKSWYIGGGQEQRFRRCFPEGLIFFKKNGLDKCYFVKYLLQIRGCSAHDKRSQKRKIWDRECWPARNRNDHTNITNEQSVTHCLFAGLARALGISSLVSRAPGITIPLTSTKN